jgi:hypothetical protein
MFDLLGISSSAPAFVAQSIEFELVRGDREAVLGRDLLLQMFNVTVLKLRDCSALRANHVVVMALIHDVVVVGLRAEVAFLGNAGIA